MVIDRFENIRNISLADEASWREKLFLTFDIDWAEDRVLNDTLDIIERYDIKATFFVTHETRLLDRMRENPKIELGIHPNFNYLLCNNGEYGGNVEEIIMRFLKLVPDSVSVRSHSVTQNFNILEIFMKCGQLFECNHFIPFNSGISLKPFHLWNGKLIKVPFFWEDDLHIMFQWRWDVKEISNGTGLKVFDFHPVHVFLNSTDLEKYKSNRWDAPASTGGSTPGVRELLLELIEENR